MTWRFFLTVPLVCALTVAPCHADSFLTAIKNVKGSISPVVCLRPPQSGQKLYDKTIDGSAFFISQHGDFLTAAHVVADFTENHPLAGCPANLWFEIAEADGIITVQPLQFSPADCVTDQVADIARCKTVLDLATFKGGAFKPAVVEIDGSIRADGTPVAMTGYPLFNTIPVTARATIAGYLTDARGLIMIDHAFWPGGSGSPVYDERGRVLGMMILAGTQMSAGLSYAVRGSALAAFIAAHPAIATPQR